MAFRHGVLLEAVFVTALFFARSAVPAEALETFGFHLVAEPFGPAYFSFGHFGGDGGGPDLWRSG